MNPMIFSLEADRIKLKKYLVVIFYNLKLRQFLKVKIATKAASR